MWPLVSCLVLLCTGFSGAGCGAVWWVETRVPERVLAIDFGREGVALGAIESMPLLFRALPTTAMLVKKKKGFLHQSSAAPGITDQGGAASHWDEGTWEQGQRHAVATKQRCCGW